MILKVKSRGWVGSSRLPPRTTPGNALYGICVCDTRRSSDRVCVLRIKPPSSLHSFPYSTARKETQRICLHSRNARINWEDCMSVPRVGDSCFTRKVSGGGPFPARPLAPQEKRRWPPSPRKSWTRLRLLAEGGPPARGRTHGRAGPPCGPTEGGAAGVGLRTTALAWAWLRARRRVWAPAGGGAGRASPRPGGARGRRGRARFPARSAHQNFCFYHPPLPFLKAKAIIYRPFRFAVFSI